MNIAIAIFGCVLVICITSIVIARLFFSYKIEHKKCGYENYDTGWVSFKTTPTEEEVAELKEELTKKADEEEKR